MPSGTLSTPDSSGTSEFFWSATIIFSPQDMQNLPAKRASPSVRAVPTRLRKILPQALRISALAEDIRQSTRHHSSVRCRRCCAGRSGPGRGGRRAARCLVADFCWELPISRAGAENVPRRAPALRWKVSSRRGNIPPARSQVLQLPPEGSKGDRHRGGLLAQMKNSCGLCSVYAL